MHSVIQLVWFYWCCPQPNFPGWCKYIDRQCIISHRASHQTVAVSWPLHSTSETIGYSEFCDYYWSRIKYDYAVLHIWKVIWRENQFSTCGRHIISPTKANGSADRYQPLITFMYFKLKKFFSMRMTMQHTLVKPAGHPFKPKIITSHVKQLAQPGPHGLHHSLPCISSSQLPDENDIQSIRTLP